MTTHKEALTLALEALESSRIFVTSREKIKHPEGTDWYDERITAIKEALAQPEQEPVAWMRHDGARVTTEADRRNYPDYQTRYSIPLYTTPPQRKPLTDEQIDDGIDAWFDCEGKNWRVRMRAAIKAAHGIKE